MITLKKGSKNAKIVKEYCKFRISEYSPLMEWLLTDGTDYWVVTEPQGQSFLRLKEGVKLVDSDGDFYKAHGGGGLYDECGQRIKTIKKAVKFLGFEII